MVTIADGSAARVATGGSPYRVILRLAAPTVLAMLTQSVVNEIDIVFFSRLPCPESSNAQAALLPSLILLWMFGGSLSAVSVGTQAIAARRYAEGKHEESGAVLLNSWVFSLLAGIVFTALGYACLPLVLRFLIKVPAVRAAARAYMGWRLLGIASMAITFSFKSFFDGIGKTAVHMVSAIVMNILNVVLCYMFIFGNLGAPRMGMGGAGLAGFVSTWIGLLVMAAWAAAGPYRRKYAPFALRKLDRGLVWSILRLSIPSGVATIAVMTGFALFSMIVSRLDTGSHAQVIAASCPGGHAEAVNGAATTVIVGILKLTFTACLAFGTSTATLVSQSLGERDGDRAARFGWASVRLGLLIFGVVGLLEGVLFPGQLLSVFTSSDAVAHAAIMPMRLMGICTPIIAVAMILSQALFGAGNTVFVMIVELILHFTCLVPLAWLLGITLDYGLIGIWSAAITYIVLLAVTMTTKFAKGDWKTIRI
ncbi:MAG TPA: MATE family efflux transporter [Polyangiaceae bacterium]|jgi:Na+-driven multidrug efflux pump|nr:MATE family efflux transporter [Polyangiaceae bacterium]